MDAGIPPEDAEAGLPISDAIADGDARAPPSDAAANDRAEGAPPVSPADRVEIVDHARWTRLDATEDPFDRPALVTCDPAATLPELFSGVSSYGVETASCNYVTLHQATTKHIAAGETVRVRLAHFPLTAPEASEAHVVVQVEDLAIFDERIAIPSASQVLVRDLVAPRPIPEGADAYFHLHNHGENSYSLISVSTGR